MKIKLDIDCTPEEARTFCGLPDVSQLNDLMIEEMKKRMNTPVIFDGRNIYDRVEMAKNGFDYYCIGINTK